MHALSIFEAAGDAPDRLAVLHPNGRLTYRELAERVAAEPASLSREVIGEATLEAIVRVLALLERRSPIVLLHPRWVEREREQLLEGLGALPDPSPAAVFFTSGTTGRPKAAMLSAEALVAAARAVLDRLGVVEDERWLAALPIAHVGGFSAVLRALISRRAIVLGPVNRAIKQATIAPLVPTQLFRLLDGGFTRRDAPELRIVFLGGGPASPVLVERAEARGLVLRISYGLTETAAAAAIDGLPLAGVEIRVGPRGTLEVRGSTRMTGYAGARPLAQDEWFDTGDLGVIENGRVRVLSRRSDLIISGGENVYPAEVEAVLESHPAVAHASVVGLEDEVWGEIVCAALVLTGKNVIDETEIRAFAETRLASFKRPRRILLLDALPETPQGKIDRTRVRALFLIAPSDIAKP